MIIIMKNASIDTLINYVSPTPAESWLSHENFKISNLKSQKKASNAKGGCTDTKEFRPNAQVLWRQKSPTSSATTMFDSWYEVLVLICCVWVPPNVLLCVMTKHLHFGLIVPEVLWFVQM